MPLPLPTGAETPRAGQGGPRLTKGHRSSGLHPRPRGARPSPSCPGSPFTMRHFTRHPQRVGLHEAHEGGKCESSGGEGAALRPLPGFMDFGGSIK